MFRQGWGFCWWTPCHGRCFSLWGIQGRWLARGGGHEGMRWTKICVNFGRVISLTLLIHSKLIDQHMLWQQIQFWLFWGCKWKTVLGNSMAQYLGVYNGRCLRLVMRCGGLYQTVWKKMWAWPPKTKTTKCLPQFVHTYLSHTFFYSHHDLSYFTPISTLFSLPPKKSHSPIICRDARSYLRRCCGSTAGRLAVWPTASVGCGARGCSWARSTCGRPRCCMVP